MSIDQYFASIEDAARYAVGSTGAIKVCEFHPEVSLRAGDQEAERHAYALATTILKREGNMFMRDDLMSAIKGELDNAVDGECPTCAHLMND